MTARHSSRLVWLLAAGCAAWLIVLCAWAAGNSVALAVLERLS